MDILISMLLLFCMLVFSIFKGIFVGYSLLLGFFIFAFTAWRRGFNVRDICKMSLNGGKKALNVILILLLIGGITGVWMASGTIPAILYWGIKYMNPSYFILFAFMLCCAVSFLLGTSFGTISTVGVAFILMAKSGNVSVHATAGAIIAGAYFGDRCSPMSSSAYLVASITKTNLYTNIRNMLKTSLIPMILSAIIYFFLSMNQPLHFTQSRLDTDITTFFYINWVALLPAIVFLVFSVLRINVKISMLVSIAAASVVSFVLQHDKPLEILRFITLGFQLNASSPLKDILKGGGIVSMWKASLVVFVSCALSGLFEGTNMLKNVEKLLQSAKTRYALFLYTAVTGIATAAFGCSQTISIVLTHQLMNKSYQDANVDDTQLAVDLENTSVVLAALIPWNIAAFVPSVTLGVSSTGFIPYAFYLYLIPAITVITLMISEIKSRATG